MLSLISGHQGIREEAEEHSPILDRLSRTLSAAVR